MHRSSIGAALLITAVFAGGCAMDVPVGFIADGEPRTLVDIQPDLRDRLDILFVVDNSDNMEELQRQLSLSFDPLVAHLELAHRGIPDLHVGVVSTDLGVGEFHPDVQTCSEAGDGGRLLIPDPACETTDAQPYLAQVDPELKNFSGTITDAFGCMARVGDTGCDYEQPLESMKYALSNVYQSTNDGFLRGDSVLAVVFVTNEDDCSAVDPTLFDPDNPYFGHNSADYRCFQEGVKCAGDDVFQPGLRQGCEPKTGSEYVADVTEYRNFLETLKPNARDLVVAGIMGDPSTVMVDLSLDGTPYVAPRCADEAELASPVYPAIRLRSFVDSFGEGKVDALCAPSGQTPFTTRIARQLRQAMGTSCLSLPVLDRDPLTEQVEPACSVYRLKDGFDPVAADGVREDLPECDNPMSPSSSSQLPCYTITHAPQCATFQAPDMAALSGLSLAVYDEEGRLSGGGDRRIGFAGQRVIADCYVAQ